MNSNFYKPLEKQVDKLPKDIIWCKKCLMSNQKTRIIFNEEGICSGCTNLEYKKNIDWEERESELNTLLDKYRKNDGSFDVIVPSSGGKDSGYVAHQLKYKYNMNPLTVTWSPMKYTLIGRKNLEASIDSGLNNLLFTPNGKFQRKFARLCLEELGDAFHVFVLGQVCFPFHVAISHNVKLVFYGENGEAEYSGDPIFYNKPYKPASEWVERYFKGSTFRDLIDYGLKNKEYFNNSDFNESDIKYYEPPKLTDMEKYGIEGKYFFSYYKNWIPQENYYYCVENTGFRPNKERSEGTYSKYSSLDDKFDGFHYYLRYIKFGLGRCSEDASHEIREGHLTRMEGINLMKQYEGEFPKKHFSEFLEYIDINENEFWNIVDSWRLDHLWKKNNKDVWELKKPII